MHTPDLSLASSYIPACLCLLKSLVVFTCFLFSPLRGWIGICSLLVTDRVLWNKINPIIDVNAVCFALAAGLAIARTRTDGVHTNPLFHFVLIGPWAIMTGLQILGVTRLSRTYEVMFAAGAVSALSCMHQAIDIPEVMALRAFMFVVSNVSLAYLSILFVDDYSDTYIHVCRTLVILLGDLRVAAAWMSVCMVCVGHQIHSNSVFATVNSSSFPTAQSPVPLQQCVMTSCHPPESDTTLLKSCSSTLIPVVDDAGLLREALARKGFSREN